MKKNGFTLVELIAVVVILSLILTLSVPSLIGALKNNKEQALEKINELIILAAKDYVVDYHLTTPRDISLSELCKNYLDCPIINPVTNEEMNISVRVDVNKNYTIMNNQLIELKVVLNGGKLSKDISGGYAPNTEIILENPTRENYGFAGWEVVSGDAVIEGSILKLGTENSTIVANWVGTPVKLSVDLDGGVSNTTYNSEYYTRNTLDLGIPTKENYMFVGWKIVSGDAVLSGNKLTFGLEDVSIKATWLKVIEEFAYSGSEQTFTATLSGYYKLEVWGAQGGDVTGGTNGGTISGLYGGYGGYSTGVYYLKQGETLYINVGGHGSNNGTTSSNGTYKSYNGGYNGGGKSVVSDYYGFVGSGGGASHIATKSGLLSTLLDNKDKVVIVSGGGGGASYYNYDSAGTKGMGGSGGGISGVYGYRNGIIHSSPGTQTSGFSFGNGGFSSETSGNRYHAGGGGGYYGGQYGSWGPGAGGSGYIGNSLLTDKTMYCYNCTSSSATDTKTISTTCSNEIATENCSKKGDGYIKISFVKDADEDTRIIKNKEYDSIKGEQVFTAPISGYYKLEVWGAQGGNVTGGTNGGTVSGVIGGYGAYSVGTTYIKQNETLYINVGSQGPSNVTTSTNGTFVNYSGGYNGGGRAVVSDYYGFVGGGGGATHIATKSGLLSSLENNKDLILIVAGGGGGAGYYNYNYAGAKGMGGSGGGLSGVSGYLNTVGNSPTTAGTQTTGYKFGLGGTTTVNSGNGYFPGGGGGFYGGYGGEYGPGGAGGSGYIGNALLTNKAMYCYNCTASSKEATKTISTTCVNETATENCAKKGNGYAKITYIGE